MGKELYFGKIGGSVIVVSNIIILGSTPFPLKKSVSLQSVGFGMGILGVGTSYGGANSLNGNKHLFLKYRIFYCRFPLC